jgi:RNA polymerase sigma factor (sigma-70 family)
MSEAAIPGLGTTHRAARLRLPSDDRLARSAASGEQRAFTAIFQRYHQELYRYCRAITGDDEDARDALQSTMLAALRALPGEKRRIALKPWLYRIAHNEAVALLRRRRSSADLSEEIPSEVQLEGQAETRVRLQQLVADLRNLPERQRGALVMRELSGMGYEQIGAAFETTPAAARQTVYEARLALHELAEGREMSCESVKQALSAGDGRVLRGRRLRAHLRSCEDCRAFQASIRRRKTDFAAILPLPAPAVAGLLHGILASNGGGMSGGLMGLLGGGTGKTLATSVALKSAAVIATATIGVGAAGVATGVINPRFIGSSRTDTAPSAQRTHEDAGSNAHRVAADSGSTKHSGSVNSRASRGGKAKGRRSHHLSRHPSAASAASTHGASSSHPSGRPSAVPSGGRSFGQQTEHSHAPQPSPQAQSYPTAAAHPVPPAINPPGTGKP